MVNYFELYGIEESFNIDEALVKKKFYELSRQYHPDRFSLADDDTKAEALKMSALNNDAYKTLTDEDKRTAYILRTNNQLEEEEKYQLPSDFLMEMMELNETVSEWEMDADDKTLEEQATNAYNTAIKEINNTLLPLFDQYTAYKGDLSLLAQVKDLYFRKKYLLRIQERMNTFATR
ncbi:MAG: Fe-S protein assembly co-chaperone HscB [Flavipsychrobacter sp.]